jgi:ketosteroid isomerase-like protein
LVRAQDYHKEIDEQIWQPFIYYFNTLDTESFLALHSKDLIRSARDSKSIMSWDQYFESQQQFNTRTKEQGDTPSIELHFTERIATADRAIDVGVYKTTVTSKNGKSRSFYGRFHVVLRKENGKWKILVDTDSSEHGTVGEKQFNEASIR